jgi:hypothetical protein
MKKDLAGTNVCTYCGYLTTPIYGNRTCADGRYLPIQRNLKKVVSLGANPINHCNYCTAINYPIRLGDLGGVQ